jgi:C1A family cysteine protease
MPGFFFLFFLSSSVLASPEELEAVRQQIRNSGARWQAEETSISKLPEEQRRMRLGFPKESFSVPEGTPVLSTALAAGGPKTPPAALNYNTYSYVTPIRDQGNCGSCWAFAATAALESQYLMSPSVNGVGWSTLNLSEQILLSCSNAGNCEVGGWPDLASQFIQSTGLPLASCFLYTATDNSCSNASCPYWQNDTYSIKGWEWVATTAPTAAALESALNTYGPLVTTMNVYSDFFYYSGGVYSYTPGSSYEGGHAIEIIGYDHNNQYFIVKNSWGNDFGVSVPGSVTTTGFFLIAYSQIAQMTNVQYGGPEFGWYTIAYEGYKAGSSITHHMVWAGTGGYASIWTLDSSNNLTTYNVYGPFSGWTPVSYNYNPGGTSALLWAGTGGYADIWTLNGSNNLTTYNVYGPFSGWTPVNYSYNPADGTRTLLWAGTGGYASIWTLDSSNNLTTYNVYGPFSGWTPVSYSYNPLDATRTLLWTKTGGYASLWTLDGSNNYTGCKPYGPFSGWTPVSYSYNPADGTATLLWAGTGGYASIWTLDSSNNYKGSQVYGPDSGWTPVSYSYNPTDGTRTLVWAGTGGYASVWTLDDSNNLTTYNIYGPFSGWTPVQYQ